MSYVAEEVNVARFRCLLANDDEMQLQALTHIMKASDFKVIPVKNGYEAFLEAQKSIKNNELFDLILLDLNMPITDGYEACMQIIGLYNQI